MSEKLSRKEMLRAYKEAKQTGGIYVIRNVKTGTMLLQSTRTIEKAANLLSFAKMTGSCVHPLVADDWSRYGADAFELEILEKLDKKETQTDAEFAEDIRALEELWREKLGAEKLY
jgi:hypothetical protein